MAEKEYNFPRDTTLKELVEATKGNTKAVQDLVAATEAGNGNDTGAMDSYVVATIDGTAAGFKRAMKLYMNLHKITDSSTPAEITTAVTGFYNLLQKNFEWDGGTKFYDPDLVSLSTGTKFGDNADLICTPSTAEVKGQNDYEGLPLFATVDCNWTIDDTSLSPIISAIEGVVGDFKRDDPATLVGVLQMTGYHYYTNPHEASNENYIEGYRIGMDATLPHCAPLPEAVNIDGTVRPWVIHGKYPMGVKDEKPTCCAGIAEAGSQSHNSSQTYAHKLGNNYSGMCSCDIGFLQLMTRVIFGSLTLDGILDFCKSYASISVAQVGETGAKRVIIPASQKTNWLVGSNAMVGTGASTDRSAATTYSTSGANGYTIIAVTDVTIDGTKYAAVYFDTDTPFDTTAGNSDNKDNTQIATIRWKTGSTDKVPGNTGAINPKSGQYPVKLQGIEFGLGAYEVLSDTIFNLYQDTDDTSKYYYEPYTVKKAANQATSITTNYKSAGVKFSQEMPEGYIKAQMWGSDGVLLPTETGGSSSTFTRDYIYHNKATVATREWLAFGYLDLWTVAGLSFVGNRALDSSWWGCAARLSPNGNRG